MTKKTRIGIIGLGTVGTGVLRILDSHQNHLARRCSGNMEIVAISARNKDKKRAVDIQNLHWYDNPLELARANHIDVVVELVGGDSGIAYEICTTALQSGKHIVTANKALIAKHGRFLSQLAEQHHKMLRYEAAVVGGVPIIKVLREGLVGNQIQRIFGIMNGTSNYILTHMAESGQNFDVVLKKAQQLGYAEADPSFDVNGIDTAHKLAIISALSFGTHVDFSHVYCEGINNINLIDIQYGTELGYVPKLLGVCYQREGCIAQLVYPCFIPVSHPLAKVTGVDNAVYIEADNVGAMMLEGPGAGEKATASAVISDLVDIAEERFTYTFAAPHQLLPPVAPMDMDLKETEYYLRITVEDKSGVLAAITTIFKNNAISLESIIQKYPGELKEISIICITHHTRHSVIKKTAEEISTIDGVLEYPNIISIESMQCS